MVTTLDAVRYGYRLSWESSAIPMCPHCNRRMSQYWDPKTGGHYAQCMNPECEYAQRKDTTQMSLTAEKQVFEVLPTGEYLVQVTDFEEVTGEFGPQVKLTFEIVKPAKFAGKTKLGWASMKLSTGGKRNSKLWDWTCAIFGRKLKIGEDMELMDLVGRQAVAVIITEKKGEDDMNKISSLKPYAPQPPFPAAGAAKPPKPPADEFNVGELAPATGGITNADDPFADE